MIMRMFAAVLVISGCSGIGFSMCRNYLKEERALESLNRCLDWMILELNYRMSPLGQLFMDASNLGDGDVQLVLKRFAEELQRNVTPEVSICMDAALASVGQVPARLKTYFKEMGASVGTLDLNGQITALHTISERCKQEVKVMKSQGENCLRNYRTLGICAGITLVIILF